MSLLRLHDADRCHRLLVPQVPQQKADEVVDHVGLVGLTGGVDVLGVLVEPTS